MIWAHLPGKQGKWSMYVRDIIVGVDGGKGVSDPKISNCSHSVEECQYIWNNLVLSEFSSHPHSSMNLQMKLVSPAR